MKKILFATFLFAFIISGLNSQTTLWKFRTAGVVYATPALSPEHLLVGSGDSCFYALSRQSGELRWRFKTNGVVHSSASVQGDMVFFGSSDGFLYALSIESGELLWKFDGGRERQLDIWDYYLSSPVVANGQVIWGSGAGSVFAVDAATGALRWRFLAYGLVHASPVVSDDKVLIGDFGGYFHAIDASTGKLVWQFRTVGDTYFPLGEIQKAALVDQGIVFVGSRDYNIYALDIQTGRGRWNRKEAGSWIIATPIAAGNSIYFGTSDTHRFYCLSKSDGSIMWQISLPGRVYGAAAAHHGAVIFGCFDGILRAVDQNNGELIWSFQTDGSKANYSKVYEDNGKFIPGFELYGKDYLESEKSILSLGSILSDPVISRDTLYFSSSDGGIYALKIP